MSENRLTKRKVLIGSGLLVGGSASLGLVRRALNGQEEIVERGDEICYETSSSKYEGEDITIDLSYEEEDRVISSKLEQVGEGNYQACFEKEELGEGYEIEEVRVGERTLMRP